MALVVPEAQFLNAVEHHFSLAYPAAFRAFCAEHTEQDLAPTYPGLSQGSFVASWDLLRRVNQIIGEGQWGDYEQALTGTRFPKNGMQLFGDLVPVFISDLCERSPEIYGFPLKRGQILRQEIHVWSVHCVVHVYPSLQAWLDEHRRMPG